jgi:hypothetical protein
MMRLASTDVNGVAEDDVHDASTWTFMWKNLTRQSSDIFVADVVVLA